MRVTHIMCVYVCSSRTLWHNTMLWIMGDVVNADQFESVTIFRPMLWVWSHSNSCSLALHLSVALALFHVTAIRIYYIICGYENNVCKWNRMITPMDKVHIFYYYTQTFWHTLAAAPCLFTILSVAVYLNAVVYDFILWSLKALLGDGHRENSYMRLKRTLSMDSYSDNNNNKNCMAYLFCVDGSHIHIAHTHHIKSNKSASTVMLRLFASCVAHSEVFLDYRNNGCSSWHSLYIH